MAEKRLNAQISNVNNYYDDAEDSDNTDESDVPATNSFFINSDNDSTHERESFNVRVSQIDSFIECPENRVDYEERRSEQKEKIVIDPKILLEDAGGIHVTDFNFSIPIQDNNRRTSDWFHEEKESYEFRVAFALQLAELMKDGLNAEDAAAAAAAGAADKIESLDIEPAVDISNTDSDNNIYENESVFANVTKNIVKEISPSEEGLEDVSCASSCNKENVSNILSKTLPQKTTIKKVLKNNNCTLPLGYGINIVKSKKKPTVPISPRLHTRTRCELRMAAANVNNASSAAPLITRALRAVHGNIPTAPVNTKRRWV